MPTAHSTIGAVSNQKQYGAGRQRRWSVAWPFAYKRCGCDLLLKFAGLL